MILGFWQKSCHNIQDVTPKGAAAAAQDVEIEMLGETEEIEIREVAVVLWESSSSSSREPLERAVGTLQLAEYDKERQRNQTNYELDETSSWSCSVHKNKSRNRATPWKDRNWF